MSYNCPRGRKTQSQNIKYFICGVFHPPASQSYRHVMMFNVCDAVRWCPGRCCVTCMNLLCVCVKFFFVVDA